MPLEGAYQHIQYPNFYSCHPRDESPSHLGLIANEACIHKSHETLSKDEAKSPSPSFSLEKT